MGNFNYSNFPGMCSSGPSIHDDPKFRYLMLSDAEKQDMARNNVEYDILRAYRTVATWLSGDEAVLHGLCSAVISGKSFYWTTMHMTSREFHRWVPHRHVRNRIQIIADVLAPGILDVKSMTSKWLEGGYGNRSSHDLVDTVVEAYETAIWEYSGKALPKVPVIGGSFIRLRWLARCRDQVGASSYLEALAQGVPAEDVFAAPVSEEKRKWVRHALGDHDRGVFTKAPLFGNQPNELQPVVKKSQNRTPVVGMVRGR